MLDPFAEDDSPQRPGQQQQAQLGLTSTQVNGHIDIEIVNVQEAISRPALVDIDLEQMHHHLYKNKYLTPQDFLEDVRLILCNAQSRAYEDQERFHRAAQMFTAAEVSILDFDPQFRMQCESMAGRERLRREQRKLEKEKSSGTKTAPSTPPPGIRRSGRNNGQQPEHPITDPVRLERRLKRQRADGAGESTGASEEDTLESDTRETKRSRMSGDDDEQDPLNLVSRKSSRPPDIHFNPPDNTVPVHDPGAPPPGPRFFDSILNPAPITPPVSDDPFLDPQQALQTHNAPQPIANSFSNYLEIPVAGPSTFSMDVDSKTQRFRSPSPQDQDVLRMPSPAPQVRHARSLSPAPPIVVVPSTPLPAAPDLVEERSPSPPLPDFYVSEELMSQLEKCLTNATTNLNVEQLEQLRATCLGTVWRHRTEWDRDALVHGLQSIVKEFMAVVDADLEEDRENSF